MQALIACGPFSAFLKQLQQVRPILVPQKEPGLCCLASLAKEFEVIKEDEQTDSKAPEVISLLGSTPRGSLPCMR